MAAAGARRSRPSRRSAISCLFDHKQGADGYTTPGTSVKVTDVPVSSPHAEEDLKPDGTNTAADKLDYAMLRLERRLSEAPVVNGGTERGFVPVAKPPRTAKVPEGLLVLQHPTAKPMKIDIGAVTWTGATRLRHSVNTEEGSSGGPVFDAGLNLVAIHHAGYDWPNPPVPHNQAVPLALILADARARGVEV